MIKNLSGIFSLCVIILISACTTTEPADPIAITGKASKGIIINGRVQAYPIVNGVIDSKAIASTITGSDGSYSLTIAPEASVVDLGAAGSFNVGGDAGYSGPLLIEVDADPNGGSKMKCDVPAGCGAVAFGQTIDLKFSLQAVVPSVAPGNTLQVAITPLTHMAAAVAKEGGLGKDGIEAANKKVAGLFGVSDIITTLPIDITDSTVVKSASTEAVKSAYLSASIAVIAEEKYSGDIATVLEKLSKSYTGQKGQLVQNESTDSLEIISMAEITQATINTINKDASVTSDIELSAALSELSSLDSAADNATPDTGKTDTSITVDSQDVTAAKGVVTAVRTWSTQFNKLESAAEKFADKMDVAMNASELFLDGVGESLFIAIEAMVDDYVSALDGAAGPFDLSNHNSTANGVIEINTITRVVTITNGSITTKDDYSGNTVVNTVNLSITMPVGSGTDFNLSFSDNGIVSNDEAKITIKKGTATVGFQGTQSNIYDNNFEADFPNALDLNLNVRIEELATTTRSNPIYFEGSAIVEGFRGLVVTETETTNTHNEGTSFEFTTTDTETDVDVLAMRFSQMVLSGDVGNAKGERITGKFTTAMDNASNWAPSTAVIATLPAVGSIKENLATYRFSTDKNTMAIKSENGQEFKLRLVKSLLDSDISYEIEQSELIGFADSEDVSHTLYLGSNLGSTNTSQTLLDVMNGDSAYVQYAYQDINVFLPGAGDYRLVLPTGVESFSANGGSFSGKLEEQDFFLTDLGETTTNYRVVSAKLEFVADFLTTEADLPPASMVLSANRTGLMAGELMFSAEYDNIKLILGISADLYKGSNGIETPSLIVIDSNTQARLTIYPEINGDDVIGKVVVNGSGVGTIEATSSGAVMVFYIDGTFESLNF